MRKKCEVLGTNKWDVVKATMRGYNTSGILFDVPSNDLRGKLFQLHEFNLEVATLDVYDRFFGAWGMIPHRDEIALNPNYTDTPSILWPWYGTQL